MGITRSIGRPNMKGDKNLVGLDRNKEEAVLQEEERKG